MYKRYQILDIRYQTGLQVWTKNSFFHFVTISDHTFQNVIFDILEPSVFQKYSILEVQGPSGPQLLVWGPSGLLDFVLRALRALRPCDPRHHYDYVRCMYDACQKWGQTNGRKAEFQEQDVGSFKHCVIVFILAEQSIKIFLADLKRFLETRSSFWNTRLKNAITD